MEGKYMDTYRVTITQHGKTLLDVAFEGDDEIEAIANLRTIAQQFPKAGGFTVRVTMTRTQVYEVDIS